MIDSRWVKKWNEIRRRRLCKKCRFRWTTRELEIRERYKGPVQALEASRPIVE